MTNIHINGEGNPGPCRAQKGGCPFASDSNHYSSNEEAQASYENAQKALGHAPNQHGEVGLSNVLDTKDEALKIANIISKEGKYAVIIESQTGYPKDGDFEDDDDNYDEENEDDDEDEYNWSESERVADEFERHVANSDWSESALDVDSMYQVKAYDSFEDIKKDSIKKYSLNEETGNPKFEEESNLEIEGDNDFDPYNIRAWRTNFQVIQPSKK